MTPQEIIQKLEQFGLTQMQIAEATSLSQTSISLIKNGKRTQVKFSTYQALLTFFEKVEKNA